jgi:hypothetical protein
MEWEIEVHSNPKRIVVNHRDVAKELISGLIILLGLKIY